THSAADIQQDDRQHNRHNRKKRDAEDEKRSASGEEHGLNSRNCRLPVLKIEGKANASAAQAHLSGKESDERVAQPLSKPEWQEELSLHPFKSRSNHIHSG